MSPSAGNLKILQVIPSLEAGGAEGFVTNLGVSLAGLGAEVRFFLMAGVRGDRGEVLLSRLLKAGIEVIGAEEHNVRSPMNILRLATLIRSWRPDIVQANMYQTEVLIAIVRGLTICSGAHYVRRLSSAEQVGYRSVRLVRMMDRVFPQTIACSPAVAVAYRAFIGKKQKSQLVTIPNGGLLQDATTTAEERLQARTKLALSVNAFVVAHIGRISGGGVTGTCFETGPKAHDVLIRAFAKAFAGNPDCVLLLVGDGPLRPKAEALAKDLGIASQTRFLGRQPEPWPVLKAADVFCFPSRYEGLPNVLPEAASCGLPVVASNIPEIRSISPGACWLLKPVDDAEAFADGLLKVASQQLAFRQIAESVAPQIRERFSMDACAEKYLSVFDAARNNEM